jgi:hypothetical protein
MKTSLQQTQALLWNKASYIRRQVRCHFIAISRLETAIVKIYITASSDTKPNPSQADHWTSKGETLQNRLHKQGFRRNYHHEPRIDTSSLRLLTKIFTMFSMPPIAGFAKPALG